jgi:hypothetical protein
MVLEVGGLRVNPFTHKHVYVSESGSQRLFSLQVLSRFCLMPSLTDYYSELRRISFCHH